MVLLRIRCARREQSLLFDLFKVFDMNESIYISDFNSQPSYVRKMIWISIKSKYHYIPKIYNLLAEEDGVHGCLDHSYGGVALPIQPFPPETDQVYG